MVFFRCGCSCCSSDLSSCCSSHLSLSNIPLHAETISQTFAVFWVFFVGPGTVALLPLSVLASFVFGVGRSYGSSVCVLVFFGLEPDVVCQVGGQLLYIEVVVSLRWSRQDSRSCEVRMATMSPLSHFW